MRLSHRSISTSTWSRARKSIGSTHRNWRRSTSSWTALWILIYRTNPLATNRSNCSFVQWSFSVRPAKCICPFRVVPITECNVSRAMCCKWTRCQPSIFSNAAIRIRCIRAKRTSRRTAIEHRWSFHLISMRESMRMVDALSRWAWSFFVRIHVRTESIASRLCWCWLWRTIG